MPRSSACSARMSARRARSSDPDRLRFDFSHPRRSTPEELERIENQVNAVIRQNAGSPSTRLMATDQAIEAGAEALFGEKYGDEVRVLTMGSDDEALKAYSVELCGGTHVRRLGDIGLFTILSESAVGAGVRRIEALTSEGARRYLQRQAELGREAAGALKTSLAELPARVAQPLRRAPPPRTRTRRREEGAGAGRPRPERRRRGQGRFAGREDHAARCRRRLRERPQRPCR